MLPFRVIPILVLTLLVATTAISFANEASADSAATTPVVPDEVLLLGPLPTAATAPAGEDVGALPGQAALVPEFDPAHATPQAGENGWRAVTPGADGTITVSEAGVYWVHARLRATARTRVAVNLAPGSALYVDGAESAAAEPGQVEESLQSETLLSAGWADVLGRVRLEGGTTGFTLRADVPPHADVAWTLAPAASFARFADTDVVTTFGSLAVADGGRWLTWRESRRRGDISRFRFADGRGRPQPVPAGIAAATPVTFLPGQDRLLARRGGELLLWDVGTDRPRTLVADETGLGAVRAAADGRRLLWISSQGFATDSPATAANRRYRHFRERIQDYQPGGLLHLYDLETGLRRVLTGAGEQVLDDSVFAADGESVFYARTLPITARPWFTTELRRIDLASGTDELLATFTAGWEVRPQHLVAHPDGESLLFLGPPDQIGDYGTDAPQHNVYHKQVWQLDLATGALARLTGDDRFSFEGWGNLPRFDGMGRLLIGVLDGPRHRLAHLENKGGQWRTATLDLAGGSVGAVASSPSADFVISTASDPATPVALHAGQPTGRQRAIADPNADELTQLLRSPAEEMSFTGPGGELIDAWLHPPLRFDADGGADFGPPAAGKAPLVVYSYGGAAATLRGFNTTLQFFAANGYGVLVVNPRGAPGWGLEFADHHAGDWGPRAGADILAALDHVLQQRPWLDAQAVGFYGGSYGGFMANHLVTVSDAFAGAVSMYGISDLATYWGQGTWGVTYGDMSLAGRNPWRDRAYFMENSPLFRADEARTPLLLLHGLVDANVTPGESVQMFSALSALDKPVEMVLFPGEDHGISGTWENRVAHREMILEWFDRWLRDRPQAWDER